jgi:hypothetical protein
MVRHVFVDSFHAYGRFVKVQVFPAPLFAEKGVACIRINQQAVTLMEFVSSRMNSKPG